MRSPPIPLRIRLPNPPAAFLGRKAESKWLRASIRNSPVSVVWGGGGVGKSALLVHALHTSFPEHYLPEMILGRSPDVHIRIAGDADVARRHIRVTVADEVAIEDLGSPSGFFLNGRRGNRAILREGDRLQLGGPLMRFFAPVAGRVRSLSQ